MHNAHHRHHHHHGVVIVDQKRRAARKVRSDRRRKFLFIVIWACVRLAFRVCVWMLILGGLMCCFIIGLGVRVVRHMAKHHP